MLDVSTARVAYVKVTPTTSNWIQPIAIGSRSNPPRDVDRMDRDRVASVDSVAVGSRSDRDPVAMWTGLLLLCKFSTTDPATQNTPIRRN